MGRRRTEEASEGEVRFLTDRMLGRLARNLRMFGLDTEYASEGSIVSLIRRAASQERWFLTRKSVRGPCPTPVLRLTEDPPRRQVIQVLRSLPKPPDPACWFSRCLLCNQVLEDLPRVEARALVPDYVAQVHRQFRRCRSCGRVFWPGTHRFRMRRTMEEWVKEAAGRADESPER